MYTIAKSLQVISYSVAIYDAIGLRTRTRAAAEAIGQGKAVSRRGRGNIRGRGGTSCLQVVETGQEGGRGAMGGVETL